MKYVGNIANELKNRTKVIIQAPEHSSHIRARHVARVLMVRAQQDNMLIALNAKKTAITWSIACNPDDTNLPLELAKMDNEIIQLEYEKTQDVPVHLTEEEKGEFALCNKMYSKRVNNMTMNHELVFGLILRQCTQLCQDKLKLDLTPETLLTH